MCHIVNSRMDPTQSVWGDAPKDIPKSLNTDEDGKHHKAFSQMLGDGLADENLIMEDIVGSIHEERKPSESSKTFERDPTQSVWGDAPRKVRKSLNRESKDGTFRQMLGDGLAHESLMMDDIVGSIDKEKVGHSRIRSEPPPSRPPPTLKDARPVPQPKKHLHYDMAHFFSFFCLLLSMSGAFS